MKEREKDSEMMFKSFCGLLLDLLEKGEVKRVVEHLRKIVS